MKPPKPIIKYNSGRGAILCNKCSVIIKENLNALEFKGRTPLLFCDKHYEEYKERTVEPEWVCLECAKDRGASPPPDHVYTLHPDQCGICRRKDVEVTEPRDFGATRAFLRIPLIK